MRDTFPRVVLFTYDIFSRVGRLSADALHENVLCIAYNQNEGAPPYTRRAPMLLIPYKKLIDNTFF